MDEFAREDYFDKLGESIEGLQLPGGWEAYWEYPGYISLAHEKIPYYIYATPEHEGENVLAISVVAQAGPHGERYIESWSMPVYWRYDLEVDMPLWRGTVLSQMPKIMTIMKDDGHKTGGTLGEKRMRVTEKQLRKIIKEELEYGEYARTPEVQQMLMDAGFNADGSFGADGYPGPSNWQMYSPKDADEAAGWIQAALDMNDALRDAEAALAAGEFEYAQDAYYKIIEPVQSNYSQHGAADTEGREVAGDWLEHKKGFKWSGSGW